ncbi:MAG: periplasmic heavy metal sensor [Candidatus Omnitrophica bacterium]|nr:periplasmic heavy metal sensor [Candidatus Omnitrophota bacterium]MCB9719285.1 periplasmic heavy metal sensor [Candidatus Omnitrophota bacterium]
MNRKHKNQWIWALAGALILIHTVPAVAQDDTAREDRRARFKARMEEKIEQMHAELGLSQEQQEKLKAHRDAKMEKRQDFRENMRNKRRALREELQKPDFDRQRVKGLHEDIKKLMNESADQRLEDIMYVREILTPEQYKAFMEKKEEFKQRRGSWRDKGSHGDHPKGFGGPRSDPEFDMPPEDR